jgi:phage tail-like protein
MLEPLASLYSLNVLGPNTELTFEILEDVCVLGRKSGVDVQLSDDMVSREHAKIERRTFGCTITDLNSSNGTKVNGNWLVPGSPQELSDGDVINIDPFRLVFVVTAVALTQLEETTSTSELIASEPKLTTTPASTPPLEDDAAILGMAAMSLEPVQDEPKVDKLRAYQLEDTPSPPAPLANGVTTSRPVPAAYNPPPGLALTESCYLQFLPDIYHTKFMARFLALFESIYRPVEWTVDNFDQFLHPKTAPADFLPWLASWFDLLLNADWSESQKRLLLSEAYQIYSRRGTKIAISRILEIYTGQKPEIDDESENLAPFTFMVTLPADTSAKKNQIEALLNRHKPAYTSYALHFD